MKLALIPPIDMLEYTDETDTQLMLPQMITNDVYRYVYQRHCDNPDQFVILDNGIAEGTPISTGQLIVMAHEFGVDEIVIPDHMAEAKATLDEYTSFWDYARESESLSGLRTMFVLQGNNKDEFYALADIATAPRFKATTIGIPRHALTTCHDPLIRLKLAKYIKARNKKKDIHLLGASPEFPGELRNFRHTGLVRSTDTSSPFNYAWAGEILHQSNAPVRRPANYFYQPFETFHLDKVEKNIKKIRQWTEEA